MELERGGDSTSNIEVGHMTIASKLAMNVIMDDF